MVEATQNILIYKLDVLYIFDIIIVCPCEICEFLRFLICYYAWLILLVQLWATKIDIVLLLSSLIFRKVDNLQKFRS